MGDWPFPEGECVCAHTAHYFPAIIVLDLCRGLHTSLCAGITQQYQCLIFMAGSGVGVRGKCVLKHARVGKQIATALEDPTQGARHLQAKWSSFTSSHFATNTGPKRRLAFSVARNDRSQLPVQWELPQRFGVLYSRDEDELILLSSHQFSRL